MTDERPEPTYARRRQLREARTPTQPPVAPPPTWAGGLPGGPTTQELELYRAAAAPPARRPFDAHEGSDGYGGHADATPPGRARAGVERWSRWAAGLGLPPRDASGRRRYPGREGMLPPAVLIAAGLGVAGLVGLLTGVLVTGGGGDATAAAALPTATVTRQVTPPAVTETRTRTRTRTTTVTAMPTQDGGGGAGATDGAGGQTLAPGAQGTAVAQLQQDLYQIGFYRGLPSGTYDEATRGAVQAFQAQNQITDDQPGVAGPTTLTAVARAARG